MIHRNRLILAAAFCIYGTYFLASPALSDYSYSPTLLFTLLPALLPTALIFIPLSKRVNDNFFRRGIWIMTAVLIGGTALLVFGVTHASQVSNGTLDPGQINDRGLLAISTLGALLSGILLTISVKHPTAEELLYIWVWSIGIFVIQFIYNVALLLFGMGPII